ncbi:MAG: hypothetical protein IJ137_01020 [Eubacterium sp.]|nr:hypothetical protein [Eubacterium sp.]
MNIYDIIIILLLGTALVLAVRRIILNRRSGKGCLGSCAHCSACIHDRGDAGGRSCAGESDRAAEGAGSCHVYEAKENPLYK